MVDVTQLSRVNHMRRNQNLRSLRQRREKLVQAIEAIERLQSLRVQRSAQASFILLAAEQARAAWKTRIEKSPSKSLRPVAVRIPAWLRTMCA